MKMFDNHGHLVAETNVVITSTGSVTSQTMYDTWSGRVVSQRITVVDSTTGKGHSEIVVGGKLLP
jgi:hypothetical protein